MQQQSCPKEQPLMSIVFNSKQSIHQRLRRRYIPTAIAIVAASLGGLPSARAASVIAGPTSRQFTIASLPDGNYRFCSDSPSERLRQRPPENISRVSGVCFRFRKQADRIIGDYYYPYEGSSICLNGRVNGNTVSGQAVERFPKGDNSPPDIPSDRALADWRQEGFLKVGQGVYVDDLNRPDAARYRSALLNLNSFYQYNAGVVSPPTNCPTRPGSFIGVRPNPDALFELGTSEYYQKPVYLDRSSIQPVSGDIYRYTTVIGMPERLSETDYRLACNSPETVQVVRSRYYDRDGDLQELEIVNQSVPADRDNPTSERRFKANQYVCQEYAQTTAPAMPTAPTDIDYQRYRNDRFDYSVLYPQDILMPEGEPTNEDGQVFRSEDGNIVLRVYGTHNAGEETLAQRYEQAQTGRSVTYRTIETDDFFVVSGNDDGDVFYQKTLLENGVFKTLELRYPQAQRREFDAIARTIADSFATTETDTGIAQLPAEVQIAVVESAARDTEDTAAFFGVVSAEAQTWPDSCLGLARAEEVCAQARVPGWRVQIEAETTGGIRTLTYRTNQTGSQVRFEPPNLDNPS